MGEEDGSSLLDELCAMEDEGAGGQREIEPMDSEKSFGNVSRSISRSLLSDGGALAFAFCHCHASFLCPSCALNRARVIIFESVTLRSVPLMNSTCVCRVMSRGH